MPAERTGPDWGLGNYERTAQLLMPAADVLVDAAELRTGEHVLDVGSGTGNVALLAAAAGASVTAVDPAERLLGVAQEAAVALNLELNCRVGDAAHLPVPDSSVDCVLSNFGIIFAPDPDEAVSEVARVLRSEGRVLLTAWLPGGAAVALSAAAQDLVREAVGAGPAAPGFAWHDASAVAALFADHTMEAVVSGRDHLTFTATSPEAYLDTELSNHPMAIAAFKVLAERGAAHAGRARMLKAVRAENEDPHQFRTTAPYVVLKAWPRRSPPT